MVHVLDGTPGNMQATPVVVNGVMYVAVPGGGVIALNAATGALKWKHQPLPNVGRGVNRGVTVADGKVFSSGGDNTIVALDAKDGSQLWTANVGEHGSTQAAPIYHDGLVYIGVSGGEAGVRGFFGAFDARTGKQVWGFWLVPGPGEPGHDTWEGDSWMRRRCARLDASGDRSCARHGLYATGNAWPDFDGSVRGGANLYTSSIVALDVKTGAYKWHFQEVHHDVWDYDNVVSPVLADIPYQGETRKVVCIRARPGFSTSSIARTASRSSASRSERCPRNRASRRHRPSRFQSAIRTCRHVRSLGAYPDGMKSACIFGAYFDEPVVMAPGTQGGMTWAPMTFNPDTRLVYVPGSIINSAFTHKGGFSRPAGAPRAGTLTAMNPATNTIVWQKRLKFPIGGGSGLLSTASGLIFHGESDGRLVAWDMNGNEVWSFQTGAGANAPVITSKSRGSNTSPFLRAVTAASRCQRLAIACGRSRLAGSACCVGAAWSRPPSNPCASAAAVVGRPRVDHPRPSKCPQDNLCDDSDSSCLGRPDSISP